MPPLEVFLFYWEFAIGGLCNGGRNIMAGNIKLWGAGGAYRIVLPVCKGNDCKQGNA